MRTEITVKKFMAIIVTLGILVVEWMITSNVLSSGRVKSTENALIFVSLISNIAILVEIYTWKKVSNELLCPYIMFLITLFIFCCGQGVGWLFGLDMGSLDMWSRSDHGITRELLLKGLCYSMMGVTCFHLGALINTKVDRGYYTPSKWSSYEVTKAYKKLGKLMFIIIVPAFVAIMAQNVMTVATGGYSAYYTTSQSRSIVMRIINILSDYYQPCLLILLIAYRDKTSYRRLIVIAMMIDVVSSLYVGGRSGAVMTLLGIVVTYHYFVKPFGIKDTVFACMIGYFGVSVLNTIADIRRMTNRGISDMISAALSSSSNVIGEFVGELGWSITSLCWTMNFVPEQYTFRHGMSYLVALVSWIPSTVFGGKSSHPVVIWGNLGDWLQNTLGMSYGPGYTMIAEAFINFGWYGLIALVVEGAILVKLIARVPRYNTEDNIIGATFQILIIMIVMKSLIRSSVSVAFRSIIFVLLPLYILIYLSLSRRKGGISE